MMNLDQAFKKSGHKRIWGVQNMCSHAHCGGTKQEAYATKAYIDAIISKQQAEALRPTSMGTSKQDMVQTIMSALGEVGLAKQKSLMKRGDGYIKIMYKQALRVLEA
jgi:hypothetical protein